MRKTSTLPNSGPDSTDYPYGSILDETDEQAGTPVIEATYSDFIQSLWQFMRVTGTTPNGLADSTYNGFQLFNAIEKYLVPVGTIRVWPSNSIPSGWLPCDGRNIGGNEYGDLFALIGTTYGGTDMYDFNLPLFDDRFPLCKGASYSTIGNIGGEKNHKLTTDEIPTHQHNNGVADDETESFVYGGTTAGMPGSATKVMYSESDARTYQGKTSYIGGGASHNNMPPYIVMNFIIKVSYG